MWPSGGSTRTKSDEQHQLNQLYHNKGYWRVVEDESMKSARNRKQLGLGLLENEVSVGDAGGMQV